MSAVDSSLLKFVVQQCSDLTDQGLPHRLELFHANEEGASRLNVYRLEAYADGEPEDLAQEVWECAENDAATRGIGMNQRYTLLMFRNEPDRENECQTSFNLRGRGSTAQLFAGDTDGATPKGLQAQQMRHSETLMQMLVQQAEMTHQRLLTENQRLRVRNEMLEKRFLDMAEAQQDLLDRSHERKLEEARETAKAQRHEQMMGTLLSVGQLFGAKLLAGDGPGGTLIAGNMPAEAARSKAIGTLLANLSQEEAAKVISSLKPDNQLALIELYKTFKEDHKAEQARKPEMLRHGSTQEENETSQESDSQKDPQAHDFPQLQ